jgi:DNA-binding beta-propeller fold protein YncE
LCCYLYNGVTVFYLLVANNIIKKICRQGTFLAEWGGAGGLAGQFHYAHDLALDTQGNIYVANTEDDCLDKFSPNFESLARIGLDGPPGTVSFDHPNDIAFDSQ